MKAVNTILSVWKNNDHRALAIIEKLHTIGLIDVEAISESAFMLIESKSKLVIFLIILFVVE